MITRNPLKYSLFLPTAMWLMTALPSFAVEDFSPSSLSAWDESSMPIVYYVNEEDASDWPEGVAAVIRSFMSWERIPGAHIKLQFAGTTEKNMAQDDGENIVTWVKEGWPYGSDTVGYAVLWVSENGQRIAGVDVLLNGQDFVWSTDGNPRAVDVQNVGTHEVGHAIGLGHSVSSPDVTMFPVILPGETRKRSISEEERLLIRLVYPSGTTRVLTYPFSARNRRLFATGTVQDYLSALEMGRVFHLTRVDQDGDGLDEVGVIYERDGQVAFYLFPTPSADAPPSEALSFDGWSIPAGDIQDVTALDIDGDGFGWEEIAVLRAESDGSFALYIYNSPLPYDFTREDAPEVELRVTLPLRGGDNALAVAGLDYDGDGVDEIGLLRVTATGTHFFDIYRIEDLGLETSEAILSVPLGVNFGATDLDVLDIDADGRWELVALWKGRRQWYVSTFQLPGSGEPPESWQAKLLSTTRIVLPSGQTPVRLSSLQIANPVGLPRPAVCIVTAERP